MKRILVLVAALYLGLLCPTTSGYQPKSPTFPIYRGMPLESECALKEQRDEQYQKLLRVSVKVSVQGGAGSGTICHYDPIEGWAYVLSCGHLWSGNKDYDPLSSSFATITVWYHEEGRLNTPRSYEAQALFWSNERGYDVSLLRFRPDWRVSYAPIDSEYEYKEGVALNSMGCDGGKEVARYHVVTKSTEGRDLVTELNSPRPGRSGGGLLTDEGSLVGICWGTSDTSSGNGVGYFTPLPAVEDVLARNGHSWILEAFSNARSIPIVDHDNAEAKYDRHYLPLPLR